MVLENSSNQRKIPFGIIVYVVIISIILYLLYPNNNGNTGSLGDMFLSFFITFGIITGLITFFLWRTKKKKVKTEQEKKETKVPVTPQKITFWTDWKTWVMLFLGYILFSIGQAQQLLNGGPFHPFIMPLPDGMLYLPIAGIFYTFLLGIFVYLALHSINHFVITFGLVFGCIIVLGALFNSWFLPYSASHILPFPLLRYMGLTGIPFPADPLVSTRWIGFGVFFTYILAKAFPKKGTDSDIIAVMVLVISAILFLPQLFYL